MYAGTKPMRLNAQPSASEIRALLAETQRTGQHPPSRDTLRSLWHPEERTRVQALA